MARFVPASMLNVRAESINIGIEIEMLDYRPAMSLFTSLSRPLPPFLGRFLLGKFKLVTVLVLVRPALHPRLTKLQPEA